MKTVALYNLKGGVGKTAAAVNLAYLATEYGHRVLLWDLDPQGAATWYLGVEPGLEDPIKRLVKGKGDLADSVRSTAYERLFSLPADFDNRNLDLMLRKAEHPRRRLRELAAELSDDFDLLILDCPPSFSLVTENVFHAADLIAAPTIPTPLSVRTYAQMVSWLAKEHIREVKLYPFLSMVDRRKRQHRELSDSLARDIRTLLDTAIPYLSSIEAMGQRRAPLCAYAPRDPGAQAFERLWLELSSKLTCGH
ncbi:ParA family protein [Thioalkalivibrio sulfidiphilus]|uniref:ParA family protein n=1 Tax=Thioalkalivibrio sulfidiphilus TaxID=1033854 RepID=UPI003B3065EC